MPWIFTTGLSHVLAQKLRDVAWFFTSCSSRAYMRWRNFLVLVLFGKSRCFVAEPRDILWFKNGDYVIKYLVVENPALDRFQLTLWCNLPVTSIVRPTKWRIRILVKVIWFCQKDKDTVESGFLFCLRFIFLLRLLNFMRLQIFVKIQTWTRMKLDLFLNVSHRETPMVPNRIRSFLWIVSSLSPLTCTVGSSRQMEIQ